MPRSQKAHTCNRCGVRLQSEDGTYHVEISVFAGVSDSLPWDSAEENEAEIDKLIDSLEGLDSDLIERDVHLELSLVLCKRCKEIFAANPLNLPMDSTDFTLPDST